MSFDPSQALKWLEATAVDDRGCVASWINPHHPGFAYPEAAAVVLRLLSGWQGSDPSIVDRLADRLRQDVQHARVGKAGRAYPFDLGVVLAALAHSEASFVHSLRRRVLEQLADPESFRPLAGGQRRWSTTRGPHLLKLSVGLVESSRALEIPPALDVLGDLPRCPTPTGRFETPPHRSTYVHAHCYAAEGLLASAHAGGLDDSTLSSAAAAVDWLARIQNPDGSIAAWHDGNSGRGPCSADVCAQAVRLWCLVDRAGYSTSIERGLSHLDRLAHPSGALRYHPDCDDLNTWATAFAVQAVLWANGEAERDPVAVL